MAILTKRKRGTTSPVGMKSLGITPEPESLAQESLAEGSWSIYSVIFNTMWEVKDPKWSILWGSMILIITGLSYHLRNLQTTFATEVQKLMNQGTIPQTIPSSVIMIFIWLGLSNSIKSVMLIWMDDVSNKAYIISFNKAVEKKVLATFMNSTLALTNTQEVNNKLISTLMTGINATNHAQNSIINAIRICSTSIGEVFFIFWIAPKVGTGLFLMLGIIAIAGIRFMRESREQFSAITKELQYVNTYNQWFSQNVLSLVLNGNDVTTAAINKRCELNSLGIETRQAPKNEQSKWFTIMDCFQSIVEQGLKLWVLYSYWDKTTILMIIPVTSAIDNLSQKIYWAVNIYVQVLRYIADWKPAQDILDAASKEQFDTRYSTKSFSTILEEHFSQPIPSRSIMTICGISGAGKTVFFQGLLAALRTQVNGCCTWMCVLQSKMLSIDANRSCKECIVTTCSNGIKKWDKLDESIRDIANALKIGYLVEGNKLNKPLKGTSGGEIARLTLIQSLLPLLYAPANFEAIFLDEVCANIDPETAVIVMRFLEKLAYDHNLILFLIDHSPVYKPGRSYYKVQVKKEEVDVADGDLPITGISSMKYISV